jgi:hypothetical protein
MALTTHHLLEPSFRMGRARSLAPVCVDTGVLRGDLLLRNFIPHTTNKINITLIVPHKLIFLAFLCYYDVCYAYIYVCMYVCYMYVCIYVCVREVMSSYVRIATFLLLTIFMKYISPEISFL